MLTLRKMALSTDIKIKQSLKNILDRKYVISYKRLASKCYDRDYWDPDFWLDPSWAVKLKMSTTLYGLMIDLYTILSL